MDFALQDMQANKTIHESVLIRMTGDTKQGGRTMVALLVLLMILTFISLDYVVQRRRSRSSAEAPERAAYKVSPILAFSPPKSPLGVFFTPGHTWLFMEPSGTVRLGITDFARSVIGSIDGIDPKSEGDTIKRGDVVLQLQHGKRKATFFSPIDGVIERIQIDPLRKLEAQTDQGYASSWLFKIKPSDTSMIPKAMLLGEKAKQWLDHEVERLKVFLATVPPEHRVVGATLQDGGVPAWGLIDSLNDADWDKFQDKFFELTDQPGPHDA
jgi:glycine cleavage system H protein